MTTPSNPSCFIIGADSLLVECGDILLQQGYEIRGVITSSERVARWAAGKQLSVIDAESDFRNLLQARPFDFLFSITHLADLPADVVGIPRRATINFHDGPLPAYAGFNVPAWALIHQESRHGITWHSVVADPDAGEILHQTLFDVAPRETSLSLNTRCFEAALESFGDLARALAEGREARTAHGPAQRRFGAQDRPPAAGLLDWRQPAARLDALVRALDFGPYPNPLGLAKIAHDGHALLVRRAEARDTAHQAQPGEVLGADAEAIEVATGEGTLLLQELSCPLGNPISLEHARDTLGMRVGAQLPVADDATIGQLDEIDQRLSSAEPHWIKRLGDLQPAEVPHASIVGDAQGAASLDISVPANFIEQFGGVRPADAVIAAVAVYLARVNGKVQLDVAYQDAGLRAQAAAHPHWLASHVPLRLQLSLDQSFSQAVASLQDELDGVRQRGGWLRDLIARQPQLGAHQTLRRGELLPVALQLGEGDTAAVAVVTLSVAEDGRTIRLLPDPQRLSGPAASALADQLTTLLDQLPAAADAPIGDIDLLGEQGRTLMLQTWNDTAVAYDREACVHQQFQAQAARTPDAVAVVFEGRQLTYRELDERSNQVAAYLRELGIGPDKLVGVCVERSLDLMVSVLGVLKAGGAYVPLDPAYPKDRLAFMLEDSQAPVLITQSHLLESLPSHAARVLEIDTASAQLTRQPTGSVDSGVQSHHLAYVIYTSGSTGKPKGVMVEHRNVVNFFRGMDDRVPHEPAGSWLAVTSLSFDISVLELFWTLSHGFKLVIYREQERRQAAASRVQTSRKLDFSVFLWGSDDKEGSNKYRLMLDAARFADSHGFSAVWTPERHFHAFGAPYPNPSVTGAAIAAVTSRLQVRAGSCVVPLHHPARVAEEWAVVDNLSGGRAGISFASGWQPNDFLLRPENFKTAKDVMVRDIETVRRLWRGESVAFPGPLGSDVEVVTQPRPVQRELPFWVTTAGNPETYRQAGAMGANLLTHLLGQTLDEVAEKIGIYRQARADAGFDPDTGIVSLMLHTYVGEDTDRVRELVREPMKEYLGSSVSLVKNFAWSFPAFKRPKGEAASPADIDLSSLSEEELDAILDFAFERYFETSGLFGTPARCLEMAERARAAGVDDIACLIDFGVATEQVLEGLVHLDRLRALTLRSAGDAADGGDYSLAAQLRDQQVTHMQCTPSMARMLLMDDAARQSLQGLEHLMVGGEALPADLARELTATLTRGTVTNMYGPTETTIWSATHRVAADADGVPIGTPIANTQIYILDARRRPVPVGVPGELYIAGDGVVRGYHDRPELTQERFVPNPFVATQASGVARMYRTGDLARFRADGVIEFLGRTDHQVKIRGYRIELGEIESLLLRHSAVREGVVVAREDNPGDQRLVAYFVADGPAPDSEALKSYLRSKLPEYMVPAHLVVLDALPLTPNGKIDRNALPAPEAHRGSAAAATAFVAPEGELAEQVARAWQETLGLERVGMDDNFFDIGGHSLLVVRLHRKLKETVDKPIVLTDLYRFPTIRLLTAHLSSDESDGQLQQTADRAARRREMMQRRRQRMQPV